MTSISDIYPSKSQWLKAEDLKGTVQRVTIESAVEGMVFEKPQVILSFAGKDKKLGLNVTNARTLGEVFGPEIEDWVGKVIELYGARVDFQGKTVDAIRIRTPRVSPARANIVPNARDRAGATINPQLTRQVGAEQGDSFADDEIPF